MSNPSRRDRNMEVQEQWWGQREGGGKHALSQSVQGKRRSLGVPGLSTQWGCATLHLAQVGGIS